MPGRMDEKMANEKRELGDEDVTLTFDRGELFRDNLSEVVAHTESAKMRAAKVLSSQKIRSAARAAKGGK